MGLNIQIEIEQERDRLRSVMYDVAHLAATLGSGSDGRLRGRFMSISNALNAAIGRSQSSHGDQYDAAGTVSAVWRDAKTPIRRKRS